MAIKICLDAGHYGKYNQSPALKSYYESVMTWKLHNLLKTELEKYGIEVIRTRESQATDKALFQRGTMSKGCDLFLSIHSNAVGSSSDETTDYPVSIVQLDGKGDKLGQTLADAVHKIMGTTQKGKIYKKRGTNGEWYGVLRGASSVGTLGIILEHSFHTNTKAAKWLSNENNLAEMSKAEAEVIADYFGVKKAEKTEEKPTGTIYRVQVGAYHAEANARAMAEKVRAKGFDTYIAKVGIYYKVQVGAYSKKLNAEATLKKLKTAGFEDSYITEANTEPTKTIWEIAEEVIKGKWGVGKERKSRLASAGYDYEIIQKIVNDKLKK